MSIEPARFSEALTFNARWLIRCDGCGRVIDLIENRKVWTDLIDEGLLYASTPASPLLCWRCKEERKI